MTNYDIARRGPGKFRSLRPKTRIVPGHAPITVRYVEPKPLDMTPEEAAVVRARMRGMSGYDMARIDRNV